MQILVRRRTYLLGPSIPDDPESAVRQEHQALALPVDEELERYVLSFRHSSDRVRHLLIASLIASVISFSAFWNGLSGSWGQQRIGSVRIAVASQIWSHPAERLAQCYQTGPESVNFAAPCDKLKDILEKIRGKNHSETSLKAVLTELEKSRVDRTLMIDVPILGIHFDINDLGAFSAIGLSLIAFALFFSMVRQQENLVFCLWKVRRIAVREKLPDNRESLANFFYHELAMAQVFTRPPTLSRWKPNRASRLFVRGVFMLPLLVQAAISINDLRTLKVVDDIRTAVISLGIQIGCTGALLIFSILTIIYSRAGDFRWHEAFSYINPMLSKRPQPPWWCWALLPGWEDVLKRMSKSSVSSPSDIE